MNPDPSPPPPGSLRAARVAALALALLLGWAASRSTSCAQEAVRASLAGEAAAAARNAAASSPGYYDLQLGPGAWNFRGGLELEANDNIRLEAGDGQQDLIFRPQLLARMQWPVTPENRLNFALGTGYSAYVQHSEFDRFFITPGSELSFDLYAGDFWLNAHDRLSILENSYQDPTVVGVANYSQLQNDAGLAATWDLNKVVLRLAYDHVNYALVTGDTGQPDGSSEVFNLAGGYTFRPELQAGLELGGGLLHYSGAGALFESATEWNLGPYFEARVTEHIRVRADTGYTVYSPKVAGSRPPIADFTGAYGQLSVSHKLNEYVEYALSGGRTVNFAFFGGTIDLSTAQLQANWKLVKGFTLSTYFQYDHGSQIFAGQEDFDRYGPGIGIGRRLTEKLNSSLRYQFYQRESNLPGGDYSANSLTLGLTYQL